MKINEILTEQQGVAEAVDTNNLTNVAHALGKLKGREVFVRIGDPRLPLSDKTEFKRGVIFDREPVYGAQPGTGPGGGSNFTYWMKDETGRDFSAPSRDVFVAKQDVAEGLDEMDKSAPQPGRDGRVSHSTYGSRDKKGSDYFKGKEAPGKPVTKKKMAKDALDILKKSGVAEGQKR